MRWITGIIIGTTICLCVGCISVKNNNDNNIIDTKAKNIIQENEELLSVNLKFNSHSKKHIEEKFNINTQSFFSDENSYNHRMAKFSFALSVSSFSSGDITKNWGEDGNFGRENKLRDAFNDLKLEEQKFYGYDKSLNNYGSTAAFGVGKKELTHKKEKYDLVIVVIRGGGYGAEWSDNFNIGSDGKYHNGFEETAKKIKKYVDKYLNEKLKNDKVRLLITGYSRGGGIANILASKYQAEKSKKFCVYAYTFATPNTVIEKENSHYENIFNIIIPYDVITSLPPYEWGFSREGKDIVMPMADETTSSQLLYNRLYYHINELTGEKYNVSDANKIKAVREIMLTLAKTREEFADNYQAIFEDIMLYSMTKVKKDKWEKISFKDFVYNKYSKKAKKAFEKIISSNQITSANSLGIDVPQELIEFMVLCEIHNLNANEISLTSIKLETIKSLFSDYTRDSVFFGTRLHAPETYLAWLKAYDFENIQ